MTARRRAVAPTSVSARETWEAEQAFAILRGALAPRSRKLTPAFEVALRAHTPPGWLDVLLENLDGEEGVAEFVGRLLSNWQVQYGESTVALSALSDPATARAWRREVADFRKAVRDKLTERVGAPEAEKALKAIDAKSEGEFFDEALLGQVGVDDPYDLSREAPDLLVAVARVRRDRLDAKVAQREGRGESGRRATESRTKAKEERNRKLRKLARDMQGATPKGSPPVDAAAVRLRLETFAEDREHILGAGAKPADVPSAETIRRALRKA